MKRFPANSRADEPVEGLLVDEDLTRCVYCDTRTAPGDFPVCAPNRAEVCLHCGQRYAVADEADDPILVELRLKPRD